MFVNKKSACFLALSLMLSPSLTHSAEYCTPETVALAAALTTVAAATWYACQPEDPEKLLADLDELTEKFASRYKKECYELFFQPSDYIYTSLHKTRQLVADIKQLRAALSCYLSEEQINIRPTHIRCYYFVHNPMTHEEASVLQAHYLLHDLMNIHTIIKRDLRYVFDLQQEQLTQQLKWDRWCYQPNYYQVQVPARVYVDVTVNTTAQKPAINTQENPKNRTKTDKSATVETKSTSIFDYSHDAADL